MKEKKTPQRMCIVCREMKDKKDLVRIVRDAEGNVSVDPTGKRNGRGAYVCRAGTCFRRCVKARLLNKAFKTTVPAEVYDGLTEAFEHAEG